MAKLHESCVLSQVPDVADAAKVPPLTADEANSLRYSTGYIPFFLKKKLKTDLSF